MSTEKHYTPDELSRLHEVLYDVLGEVVRICERHDIPYFLIGGTAIGALYDEAILPWDDDVDIGMKRDDYERFLRIAPSELGREYFLSWQETDPHSPYYFAKVKKNGTLFVEELFHPSRSFVFLVFGLFLGLFRHGKLLIGDPRCAEPDHQIGSAQAAVAVAIPLVEERGHLGEG